MAEKLSGMKWLNEHIKKLEITTNEFKDTTKEIVKIDTEVCNEFKAWTPLKLVLLNYTLDVCSSIISSIVAKAGCFEKSYYIDLFAGSGLNKIKKDYMIGSPLIAALKYSDRFNTLFFCENDSKLFSALDKRLKFLSLGNISLQEGDCNTNMKEILKEIDCQKTYSFFFIDPYCMDFSWESMDRILKLRSDIVFTFMTSEIHRAIGLVKSGGSEGKKLTSFFGDNSWQNTLDYVTLVDTYKRKILGSRPNALIEDIAIKSAKHGFCYHILFITNNTKNGCPWMKAIHKAKQEIESNSDISVEKALEIVTQRQKTLF